MNLIPDLVTHAENLLSPNKQYNGRLHTWVFRVMAFYLFMNRHTNNILQYEMHATSDLLHIVIALHNTFIPHH